MGIEGFRGNREHLGVVEQGHPVPRPALRLAQHPAGARRRGRGFGPSLRRLEQGAAGSGPQGFPALPCADGRILGVKDHRETAGDEQTAPRAPVLGRDRVSVMVNEEQLGRSPPQQPFVQRGLADVGRIQPGKAQCGFVSVKRLAVFPRFLFVVTEQPELALAAGAREILHASTENRFLRLPVAGELHHAAGAGPHRLETFEGGDERGGADVSVRQAIGELPAGRQELGLPGDLVLAVNEIGPFRVRAEVDVLQDPDHEVPGVGVVDTDAAGQALAIGAAELSLFVQVLFPVRRVLHDAGPA